MRRCLDRALTFAGATQAAVYAPAVGDGELRLMDASGDAPPEHGPPDHLPLSGDSPAARAYRNDRPLWLTADTPLGALPLDADGRRLGCLVVRGASVDGFDIEQRQFLERYADALAVLLRPAGDAPAPAPLLAPALRTLRVGSFVLFPDTGLIEADETLLDLVGISPDDFDGKAETLLAHALPEDMPAADVRPGAAAHDVRRPELEFRVRGPTGETALAEPALPRSRRAPRRARSGAGRGDGHPGAARAAPTTSPGSSGSPPPSTTPTPSATSAAPWSPPCASR